MKKMDGGSGASVKPPKSGTMAYYQAVQKSGSYVSGHEKSTGKQGTKVSGVGDTTRGAKHYKKTDQKINKGPNGVVSKKITKKHTSTGN